MRRESPQPGGQLSDTPRSVQSAVRIAECWQLCRVPQSQLCRLSFPLQLLHMIGLDPKSSANNAHALRLSLLFIFIYSFTQVLISFLNTLCNFPFS